jgi:hypothetical protein
LLEFGELHPSAHTGIAVQPCTVPGQTILHGSSLSLNTTRTYRSHTSTGTTLAIPRPNNGIITPLQFSRLNIFIFIPFLLGNSTKYLIGSISTHHPTLKNDLPSVSHQVCACGLKRSRRMPGSNSNTKQTSVSHIRQNCRTRRAAESPQCTSCSALTDPHPQQNDVPHAR